MRNGSIYGIKSLVTAFLALVLGANCVPCRAAEEKPVRAFFMGNSLTDQLRYPLFEKLCGAAGHPLEWKNKMRPGVPVSFWWTQKPAWEKDLTKQQWDVITLQPFQNFEVEFQGCENFAKFFQEHQPDTQLYIYAQWPHRQTADWLADFLRAGEIVPTGKWSWDRNCREKTGQAFWLEKVAADAQAQGLPAKVERSLKNQYELTVLGLRARAPMKNPVKLIPVGHVLELLDSKMRAGLVPAYTSSYQFYVDKVHVNNVGCYIVACTFYATIFESSPVGLPVSGYGGGADFPYPGKTSSISDELAKVIQETVWEVVATHPLTGVTTDEPVKVATASLPLAVQGEPYQFQLQHAFGKAPCSWSVAAGALPDGLALSPEGTLAGTAAGKPGEYKLNLVVTDASGAKATRELPLTVEADSAPTITTAAKLPPRQLGEYFTMRLEAKGGNGAMLWEDPERKGSLPPGLVLHPDGALSGSPGQEGAHSFTVRVTDSDRGKPETTTARFTIQVSPPGLGVFRVRPVDKGEVNFDGVPDESFWDLKEPIEKLVAGEKTNIKAVFDIVRQGGDMYVAVKVIDPDRKLDLKNLPEGDSVEVFVDVLNNREQVYNHDDRRVVIAPAKTYRPLVVAPTKFGHQGKCVETEDGYSAEFWLSFWALNLRNRNYPAVMGFDIAVNDDDDGNGRDSQVVWQGTNDNATVPQFGAIILEPDGR